MDLYRTVSEINAMNVNRKSWVTDRSVSASMTSNDLEQRDARGQNFKADVLNSALII